MDEPDPEAMRDRPVAASGSVESDATVRVRIPDDSRGGVEMSAALLRRRPEPTLRVEALAGKPVRRRRPLSGFWLAVGWALAVVGVAAVAGVVAYHYRQRGTGDHGSRGERVEKPVRLVVAPGECPEGMVWVGSGTRGFCIDRFEFPNVRGTFPQVVSGLEQASALCAEQGKRLCTRREWERACAGAEGRRYPYGNEFSPTRCPVRTQGRPPVPLQSSGSWPECKTPEGIYDLSGNLAEWVAEGILMGGSGALSKEAATCRSAGGGGAPAYYGLRCCLSPALPARR